MPGESAWSPRLWSLVERHATGLAVLLLLIYVTLGAFSATQDSATYDEGSHLAFGLDLLDGKLEHANMQRMPITAVNAVPKWVCRRLRIHLAPDQELLVSRLPSLLFPALTGWFVFVWSRRLYGPRGALLSLTLLLFCPTFLAHGRLITTDSACAFFFLVATLSFLDYLRRPSWPRFFLLSLLVGCAQLSKHTALLLFPLFLTILGLRRWALGGPAGGGGHPMARGLLFLAMVVLIINAGYRFKGTGEPLQQHVSYLHGAYGCPEATLDDSTRLGRLKASALAMPLPLPRVYVETYRLGQHYNQTGEGHGPVYMLGERSKLGWKSYFAVALALKTPLPSLLLILVAFGVSWRMKRLGLLSDELVCLLSAGVVFSYFSLLCTAQIGVRYLLPMLPFLYVFVGQVADWPPFRRRWVWRMGGAAMLVWLALSSLSYFPHYISYFNEICWDRRFLYKYLADSNLDWDQGRRALEQYLKLHAGETISVDPASRPSGTFIVRANRLLGLEGEPNAYQWLREKHAPVAHVAYSYLVYTLPSALAASDGQSNSPSAQTELSR